MTRQSGFDAALAAYLPGLRKRAEYFIADKAKAEELVQDTVVTMLNRSESCRMATFKTWAQFVMLSVWGDKKKAARTDQRTPRGGINRTELPNQEDRIELVRTMGLLADLKHGDIIIRKAMGESLKQIADERGVCRSDISQKYQRALEKLRMAA